MKKIILSGLLFCSFLFQEKYSAMAVPAYNKRIAVSTCYGDVSITLHGDEKFAYALSEDGYTLLNDEGTWKYAIINEEGFLVPSKYTIFPLSIEDDELRRFKEHVGKNVALKVKTDQQSRSLQRRQLNAITRAPIIGEKHAIVILMQYKDVSFKKSKEDFEDVFNTIGYCQGNAKGSVRDYYAFASQGKLDYISDIFGPYTAKYDMKYYGSNGLRNDNDEHAYELCMEAVSCLPSSIDFSRYDNDHNGIIDNVHIIFAGYGEEAGASSNAIWSHEYPNRIYTRSIIGYDIAGYSCSPELSGNRGSIISPIGVICHELGHALGASDYYDTDYAQNGTYDGTGIWDIMSGGSWNDDGASPPNFNPYVRAYDFGWNRIEEVLADSVITLPCMGLGNSEDTPIYRLSTPNDEDFYLLENRQKKSFDESLPESGLLIYHVNPNINRLSKNNTINATHPQGLYPVCAKNSNGLDGNYGNINSEYCVFPGKGDVHEFGTLNNPKAFSWDGQEALCSLFNILEHENGSISFSSTKTGTINENDDDSQDDDSQNNEDIIYRNSFEDSKFSNCSVTVLSGRVPWRVISARPLFNDNASDGVKYASLSLQKGEFLVESAITSDMISVSAGHSYEMLIDIRETLSPSSNTIEVSIETENANVCSERLTNIGEEWRTIRIPFEAHADFFSFTVYGKSVQGDLCIDNICIVDNTPSSVASRSPTYCEENNIYDLNGRIYDRSNRGFHIINHQLIYIH